MRVLITNIGREYGLNPDQMFAFASHYDTYSLQGTDVDNATVPAIMARHLAYDFKRANKKKDWRKNLVSESLDEFLKLKKYNEI